MLFNLDFFIQEPLKKRVMVKHVGSANVGKYYNGTKYLHVTSLYLVKWFNSFTKVKHVLSFSFLNVENNRACKNRTTFSVFYSWVEYRYIYSSHIVT